MARVGELEQGRARERPEKRADDAADDRDGHADHRPDHSPDQGARAGARGSPVSLGVIEAQPLIDEFSEKREAEHDRNRCDADRPKPREPAVGENPDRKSTRLNSSHVSISYAVFCLKKKTYPSDSAARRTQLDQ